MASLNKVLLIGNLTRDPQLKYLPSGSAVADVGLAVNRVWTGKDGQRQEETTFVDVVMWGRTAEIANEYLTKGSPIFIEGRLQLDQWETKEGEKRSKMRVVCERMQFLGSRGDRGQRGAPSDQGAPEEEVYREPMGAPQGPQDDIPF